MPMALAAAEIEREASMRSSSSKWSQRRPREVGERASFSGSGNALMAGSTNRIGQRCYPLRHNENQKKAAAWRPLSTLFSFLVHPSQHHADRHLGVVGQRQAVLAA